jgi:hypothetical protein
MNCKHEVAGIFSFYSVLLTGTKKQAENKCEQEKIFHGKQAYYQM